MSTVLAYDLGAGSGRAILGRLTDRGIVTEELHRFPNDPVAVGSRLQWDILRLYHEIKAGLLKAKLQKEAIASLGIDSWAVDFGLIGANGELLGNPYHYRDTHTEGVMTSVAADLSETEIFGRTGIQFLPFNTIYQLAALKRANSPLLREAERLLMIPDLLRYFLTGNMLHEFTNATTTQLYNPNTSGWDEILLAGIGIPASLFGKTVMPGTLAGELLPSVCTELGIGSFPVIAVAEHDTGSAVAAVPAESEHFAYLICGTWSLLGTELDKPVLSEEARQLNFTNEGGYGGTYRFLKNIMGLWLIQEYKRELDREGHSLSFADLVGLAEEAPGLGAFIDPDDPRFMTPGPMTPRIRAFLRETGQPAPDTPGGFARCVLDSLALKYRYILELTERLTNRRFDGLHMVGGGIQNRLLCRLTANATRRPVWAGPAEGSGIGNLAVQWIAGGQLSGIREARRIIRESFPIDTYEPADAAAWDEAYGRFMQLTAGQGLDKKHA